MTFGNRTLTLHLLRGVTGFGALAGALSAGDPWIALPLLPVALVALRGCPVCWTIGLFETLAIRLHARHDPPAGSTSRP